MKMSISEKIKTINNKIKQSKAQFDLERQTAKISALSSRNVSKYEIMTSKDVLAEKHLVEKPATVKRIEYLSLAKELKAKTDITIKQYQGLDKAFISTKKVNQSLIQKQKKI